MANVEALAGNGCSHLRVWNKTWIA